MTHMTHMTRKMHVGVLIVIDVQHGCCCMLLLSVMRCHGMLARIGGCIGAVICGLESEVRANAETPADARQAKEFGAEGIGLVRTEHMFFEGQRIVAMRQMILATDEAGRREALDKLLVMQRDDITEPRCLKP